MSWRIVVAAAWGWAVIAGCAPAPATGPDERAVRLTTTACGDASATTGSGVLVGGGRMLSAAHLVIGAASITVTLPDGSTTEAIAEVVDTTRDLAVLRIDTERGIDPVVLTEVDATEVVTLNGGDETGEVDATVRRAATLVVDEVRGTARHERGGYELEVAIERGDSGSGIYAGNRLVGIVFARSSEREATTFAVDDGEIEAVLSAATSTWRCDRTRSRLIRQ